MLFPAIRSMVSAKTLVILGHIAIAMMEQGARQTRR